MRRLRSTLLTTVALAACAGGQTDPGTFDPPFENTRTTFSSINPKGKAGLIEAAVSGTRTVGDRELPVLTLTYPVGGNTTSVDIVGKAEGSTLTLGGLTVPQTDFGIGVDVTFDEPVDIDMTAVGTVQMVQVDGALTIGDPTVVDPGYLPFDLEVEVLEVDVIAPAPMGDVPGCSHARVAMDASGLGGTGEIWTRDDIGLVHAVLDTVPFGRYESGTAGWVGFDDAGGRRMVKAERVIDANQLRFSVSSYDIANAVDADKDTHAQMWLELRWADADKARTTERPNVAFEFGTGFGYFPAELVQTDVSVLHPDDRDEGFVYWVAFVDQAAKNEAFNPISFGLSATHDGVSDPVLAGGFVRYKPL